MIRLIDKLITNEQDLIQPVGNLVLEPLSETAHILGAAVQLEEINPSGIWWDIEITPELQRLNNGQDLFNCVNNATNNVHEFIYKKRYGKEVNWSDIYSAILTGTVPGRGNSFENVFEKIRKNFCAWEHEFPTWYDKTVAENYARKIPDGLRKEVEARGKGFEIRYQFLNNSINETFNNALKISPITVAVEGQYIWKNGRVVNSGTGYNHAVVYLGEKDGVKIIFDSESNQVIPFDKNYRFASPAVHSIKKLNTMELIKKKGQPAIAVKVEQEDALMAFSDGVLAGGKLFKSLYGVDDYKTLPRLDVDEWPYPIKYLIKTTDLAETSSWTAEPNLKPNNIWDKFLTYIKNLWNT